MADVAVTVMVTTGPPGSCPEIRVVVMKKNPKLRNQAINKVLSKTTEGIFVQNDKKSSHQATF